MGQHLSPRHFRRWGGGGALPTQEKKDLPHELPNDLKKLVNISKMSKPHSMRAYGPVSQLFLIKTRVSLKYFYIQSEESLLRLSKGERILPEYEELVSTTKKQKKKKDTGNGKRDNVIGNL